MQAVVVASTARVSIGAVAGRDIFQREHDAGQRAPCILQVAARDDEGAEAWAAIGDARDHGNELGIQHHGRHACAGDDVGQNVAPIGGVDRHLDDAELGGGEPDEDVRRHVLHHHGAAVTGLDAARRKAGGDAVGLAVDRGVGVILPVPVHYRMVRALGGTLLEDAVDQPRLRVLADGQHRGPAVTMAPEWGPIVRCQRPLGEVELS